jgi:hypothetical protein
MELNERQDMEPSERQDIELSEHQPSGQKSSEPGDIDPRKSVESGNDANEARTPVEQIPSSSSVRQRRAPPVEAADVPVDVEPTNLRTLRRDTALVLAALFIAVVVTLVVVKATVATLSRTAQVSTYEDSEGVLEAETVSLTVFHQHGHGRHHHLWRRPCRYSLAPKLHGGQRYVVVGTIALGYDGAN